MALVASIQAFFITDCDNTIAYYDNEGVPPTDLIELPASSGSGKTAYVAKSCLQELEDLASISTVICASGMRVSTMLQRQPFFLPVSYWICENGGRIYCKDKTDSSVKEIIEWKDYVYNESAKINASEELSLFASQLSLTGWNVDTNYETMIRVKKSPETSTSSGFESVISMIPANLKYTFNLGHLDIQLPMCSKLAASTWLMNHITASKKENTVENNNEDSCMKSNVPSNVHTIHTIHTIHPPPSFLFMGDDDNDVGVCVIFFI